MKIHARALAAIKSLSGLLSFGAVGDGQALKRVGGQVVGADLTAEETGAVPDTHDDDGQVPYYNGGWGNINVGASGLSLMQAATELQGRSAISAVKTWQKTAAPTVSDDVNAGYAAGDFWNDTTNNRTYIADSVSAGAADWRSLLPVSRIVADISGGAWRAAGYASLNGSWIRVTDYKAPTYTQDPEAWGYSLSGTDIAVTTGAGIVNSNLRTEAPGWGWALSDFGVGSLANQRLGTIDASVSSISLTSAAAPDYNGVVGVYSTASNLSTGAMFATGIGKSSTNYAWLKSMANALITAYAFGPNVRRVQAFHLIPLLSGADPDVLTYDSGGAILNAGGSTSANTASGTPTHVGVFLARLGTTRNGTISAPAVTFDFGTN